MDYYYNRDYLQDRFDKDENKLIVYCEIDTKIFTQEIIFNEDMSINFKCSCNQPFCQHLNQLVNFIKNNYTNTYTNNLFKINLENFKNFLSIPISGSKGDLYLIDIKYDYFKNFTYSCSCGLKYTKYKRHKCKHVLNTLSNIVNNFNNKKEEYDESSSITNAINDLDIK